MKKLEFECFECKDKIVLEVTKEEYDYYLESWSLPEGSEAYKQFFDGAGWVLQQNIYCDLCKYDHSEVYADYQREPGILEQMIENSFLLHLSNIEFEEKSEGRFFQKEKKNLWNGLKQFYVILGPNVESPIHNHKGENIEETHLLLYGSGKFVIYDKLEREMELEIGKFHPIFSTQSSIPDHKYVAGPEGSICLALEKHITGILP